MLKQAVGVLASIIAVAFVSLALAVLVRLSWNPGNGSAPETSSKPD